MGGYVPGKGRTRCPSIHSSGNGQKARGGYAQQRCYRTARGRTQLGGVREMMMPALAGCVTTNPTPTPAAHRCCEFRGSLQRFGEFV
jgi:hypothetical protein